MGSQMNAMSETDMNLCRLAQSLESDTVLLIFKKMYPHQNIRHASQKYTEHQ